MSLKKSVASDRNTELFESASIPRAVLWMTLPTVLSYVITAIYSLVDTFFVGMINDPLQNAAIALTSPMVLAFHLVTNLFGTGASSVFGRALGARDHEFAANSASFGLLGAFGCAMIFSLFSVLLRTPLLGVLGADEATRAVTAGYLFWTVSVGAVPTILSVVLAELVRAEGEATHACIGTITGCILNVILDPVFVLPFGLGMGAEGAGLATCISYWVSLAYFVIFLCLRKNNRYIKLRLKRVCFSRQVVDSVCRIGVPASIQNAINVVCTTVMNNLIAGYGPAAVAASGIAYRIQLLPYDAAVAFSHGIMPLISYSYGAANYKRLKKTVWFSGTVLTAVMTVIAVAGSVWAGPLVALFIKDAGVIESGEVFLRGYMTALPFLRIDFLAVCTFIAAGKGKPTLLLAFIRKVALQIPLLFAMNSIFRLNGIAYTQLITEIIMALIALVLLRRMFTEMGEINEETDKA